MIKGVLFDMDGVLADSEQFICSAAVEMFRELGYIVKREDFKPFTGTGENRYLGGVAEKYGVHADMEKMKSRTYEIYGELVKGTLLPLPGAREFVGRCRRKGFRLALATSADRIKMDMSLREIGIPPETFDSIVTGLDVVNKKPAPDIYLKAAENIGLSPDECLVVEDAVSGVSAGKAAGCRCLAVTTSFPAKMLADADWITDSLGNVPEDALNW
ncbi:MAG TPA: HAD-IA family hydrolase [Bacteroidales bacterium]|nr:HAD-IA family hydrolase [Bacteroidales bacterium]